MGRHSSVKSRFALAPWVIVTIIAVLIAIIVIIALAMRSPREEEAASAQEECIQGNMALPIATDELSRPAAELLISSWAGTQPVVRDYCVQPEIVDDVSVAAGFVGTTLAPVHEAGRTTSSTEGNTVASIPLGISNGQGVTAEDVTYPVADSPEISQVAASALAEDEATAQALLNRDALVTSEEATQAQHYPTTDTDDPITHIAVKAVALNAAGEVSEEQQRAATAFVEYAAAQYSGEQADSVNLEMINNIEPASALSTPADTLFLLDTSAGLSPGEAQQAIVDAASHLVDQGHEVALWNYSSPLNPGVTKGWRSNLGFGASPEEIASVISSLGSGGQPQSRSAAIAAMNAAAERSTPSRVVLISSGSEAIVDDAQASTALNDASANGAQLVYVHVGDGPVDNVLSEAAAETINIAALGELGGALEA